MIPTPNGGGAVRTDAPEAANSLGDSSIELAFSRAGQDSSSNGVPDGGCCSCLWTTGGSQRRHEPDALSATSIHRDAKGKNIAEATLGAIDLAASQQLVVKEDEYPTEASNEAVTTGGAEEAQNEAPAPSNRQEDHGLSFSETPLVQFDGIMMHEVQKQAAQRADSASLPPTPAAHGSSPSAPSQPPVFPRLDSQGAESRQPIATEVVVVDEHKSLYLPQWSAASQATPTASIISEPSVTQIRGESRFSAAVDADTTSASVSRGATSTTITVSYREACDTVRSGSPPPAPHAGPASAAHALEESTPSRPTTRPSLPHFPRGNGREPHPSGNWARPPSGFNRSDSGSTLPEQSGKQPAARPASRPPTPQMTPQSSPRLGSQQAPRPADPLGDGASILAADGNIVDAAMIEQLVRMGVEAVSHCMLVTHHTSDDVGCLITLKTSVGSQGVALDKSGLQLASRSGSEATTVMLARQCALFRRGLAQALESVNHRIAGLGVQIKRFQVLREDFSVINGSLVPPSPARDGESVDAAQCELNRRAILQRHRHMIDDMYQHEARYAHKWMATNLDGLGGRQQLTPRLSQVPDSFSSNPNTAHVHRPASPAHQTSVQPPHMSAFHAARPPLPRPLQPPSPIFNNSSAPGSPAHPPPQAPLAVVPTASLRQYQPGMQLTQREPSPRRCPSPGREADAEARRELGRVLGMRGDAAGDAPFEERGYSPLIGSNGTDGVASRRASPAGSYISFSSQPFGAPRSSQPSPRGHIQPSPRGYSPRMRSARDPPPHALSQKRLPEHVRLLTLAPPGGGAPVFDGQATPRGRYSPSFAANAARPFDPDKTPRASVLPVGQGPLGLPIGGANTEAWSRSCGGGAFPKGRPPRPTSALEGPGEARQGGPGSMGGSTSVWGAGSGSSEVGAFHRGVSARSQAGGAWGVGGQAPPRTDGVSPGRLNSLSNSLPFSPPSASPPPQQQRQQQQQGASGILWNGLPQPGGEWAF